MISPLLSVYFDLVRFLAAVSVLLSHVWPMAFAGAPPRWPGHEAVVVFFVLSGTMMAHVTGRGGGDLRGYTLDRLARLWSGAVPVLVLGGAMALAVGDYARVDHPSVAAPPEVLGLGEVALRSVMNLLLLGESTLASGGMLAPNNGPFWSLSYEALYYWMFGTWFYLRAPWRWPVVVALAVIAGPRVLLLMPCWLAGVAVYWLMPRVRWSAGLARVVLVVTLALLLAYCATNAGSIVYQALRPYLPFYRLRFSNLVVSDWLLALVVAANFLAVAQVGQGGQWLLRAARPIVVAAGGTLTIYLFHVPLAFLAAGWLGLGGWALVAAVVVPLAPIAWLTEMRRRALRRALDRIVPGRAVRSRALS